MAPKMKIPRGLHNRGVRDVLGFVSLLCCWSLFICVVCVEYNEWFVRGGVLFSPLLILSYWFIYIRLFPSNKTSTTCTVSVICIIQHIRVYKVCPYCYPCYLSNEIPSDNTRMFYRNTRYVVLLTDIHPHYDMMRLVWYCSVLNINPVLWLLNHASAHSEDAHNKMFGILSEHSFIEYQHILCNIYNLCDNLLLHSNAQFALWISACWYSNIRMYSI